MPCSLIEQSRCSGLKNAAESTTGILPGNRGKEGGNWCRPPLDAARAAPRHMSPVPLAGVVSGQFTHESGTVRRGVIRNHAQPSQVRGKFRTADPRSHPRGYRLLLRRPERQSLSRRDDPAKRPAPQTGTGAQRRGYGGERTDLAKSVHLLRGRCRKTASPPCKRETQPERQEVRPVTRGQRPANPRRRPRGHGADAKHLCRRVSTTSGARSPAGDVRTGRRGLTRKIPAGNGRDGPAMRPELRLPRRVASGNTPPAKARAPKRV